MNRDPIFDADLATARASRSEIPDGASEGLQGEDVDVALIMTRLARLSRVAQAIFTAQLRSVSMSYTEYYALHELAISESPQRMTPSRLNQSLGLSSGGVTKTIDRLEAGGLIRRSPDPDDGRGVLVSLTARGRRRANLIFSKGVEHYVELLKDVDGPERKRLASTLRTLLEILED